MPHRADDTTLAERHYVTLIVRLTLDEQGRLIQGALLDTANSLPEHFLGAPGLTQAVTHWLQQQEHKEVDEKRR